MPQNMYERFPISLCFVDPRIEARYCRYLYRDSGFYGGKIFLVFIVFYYIFLFTSTPNDLDFEIVIFRISSAAMTSLWVLIAPICMKYSIDVFYRYMEPCMMVSIAYIGFCLFASAQEGNEQNGISLTSLVPLLQTYFFHVLVPTRFAATTLPFTLSAVFASIFHFIRHHRQPVDILWYGAYFSVIRLHYALDLQNRRFFADIDKCATQLSKVRTTLDMLDSVVMSYLPPTAMRDFLLRKDKDEVALTIRNVQHVQYPNTVLVVTDLVGFTAWSSRTPASVVVDVLARCFVELDETATSFGIEKITTVGDSYVGAVFSSAGDDDDINDRALRCVCGIRFGLVAAELPSRVLPHLRNRVGVHMGSVVGGFVGTSPPRFDLFGFATDFAKHMESTCEPGYVHVSLDAYECARRLGSGVDVRDIDEDSVLLSGWVMGDYENNNNNYDIFSQCARQFTDSERREVCSMFISSFSGNSEKAEEGLEGSRSPSTVAFNRNLRNGCEAVAVTGSTWVKISPDELDVFAAYMSQKSNFLTREALAVVFLCLIYVVVCSCTVACLEESATRFLLALNMTALVIGFIFVSDAAGYTRFISCVVCLSVAAVSFSVISVKCLHDKQSAVVLFNAGSALKSMLVHLPLFCLDVPVRSRLIGSAISSLCFPLMWYLRESFRGDEDAELGLKNPSRATMFWALNLLGIMVSTMNFELTARAGFRATQNNEAALHSHGTFAQTSERVLSMMMPLFAVEAIEAQLGIKSKDDGADDPTQTATSDSHLVWDYPTVSVAFITFHLDDDRFDAVAPILQRIEDIAHRHGVTKVKSVNTTTLLVAGLSHSFSRQHQADARSLSQAVVDVFTEILDPCMSCRSYSAGMHTGACVGAVLGTKGLSFDVFGDTVNTASRMQTTSPPFGFQLSMASYGILGTVTDYLECSKSDSDSPVLFELSSISVCTLWSPKGAGRSETRLVNVKGKGGIEVVCLFVGDRQTDASNSVVVMSPIEMSTATKTSYHEHE